MLGWYPLPPDVRLSAPAEERLITVFSPPLIINGNNDLVTRYTPLMLTSQFVHHCIGSLSIMGVNELKYPALLIRISRRPSVFSISLAAFSTLSWSVTSSSSLRTLGAFFPDAWAADLISDSKLVRSERALMTMASAPAFANESAVARPRPLEAPVTQTILPLRSAFAESISG